MRIPLLVVALGVLGSGCLGDNWIVGLGEPGTGSVTISAFTATTSESGGQATFTVVLDSQPLEDVTLTLATSDDTEGTVQPASLRFTNASWSAPQTVTVRGVDDPLADGNVAYTIVTSPLASADLAFDTFDPADPSLTNIDNDTPGVTVSPSSGITTTEAGGQANFAIFLHVQPATDVRYDVSSSVPTEGTADRTLLTFTTNNWNAAQLVTVTGVDDAIADGNTAYSIVIAPAAVTDPAYVAIDPADVAVTNIDNETAGITVTPTSGLQTTEAGGTDTFTIALNTQPTADVTIDLASSDTTEGTVGPASLTFTSANWNAPQEVTVTGVDDVSADGDQNYSITTAAATSSDTSYAGRDAPDVQVTNLDNDIAAVLVTPTSGLVTTEAGGTASFDIVLATQPTADVTIAVMSGDTTEGTVSTGSVVFTSVNWNAPQTVTVTGVDDAIADGSQPYTIVTGAAASADVRYQGRNVADVLVNNTDNDSAGITVTPTSGLSTTEAGGQDTFTIVLVSQPAGNVVIGVSSSDTTEATVSPSSVTFTSVNWNAPRVVTATGVNDFIADGNQPFTIITAPASSSDNNYISLDAPNVTGTNLDNDSPGIVVAPVAGLVTNENGQQAQFTIVLSTQPSQPVTIGLTSSDPTEGSVSPSGVTFTTVNWNAPQVVTVTGVNDLTTDGSQPYTIITAAAVSSDPGYSGRNAADVSVTNLDDDNGGIVVSPTSGLVTTESGGFATFSVVLLSAPTSDVVIPLSSSDSSEGSPSPISLTFTTVNWAAPQVVTVTGADDVVADGNQPYQIITAAAVSADATYGGLNAADVSVSNTDNDSPGFLVTPTSGLMTSENGGTDTFTVVLTSQPSGDVTIALSSSDPMEGTPAPAALTFTNANWSAPQTVTVTGLNDALADGNQPYTIITGAATSIDGGYNGLDPSDVVVTNLDNDTANIIVTPANGLVTTEAGGFDVFTIVLGSQPSGNVTIGVSSSDLSEGDVVPASITFTSLNWFMPQSVTVTGVNDALVDGNVVYTVITAPATSSDSAYNNLDAANVAVTNLDDDGAGFTLEPDTGLIVSEFGDTDDFTIVLNTQPTSSVTINFTSSDPTEGTVSPASVTFTTGNWNNPRTITVTGVNDNLIDGNQQFFVVTSPAVSADAAYSGLNPPDVDVLNIDNETPQVYVKTRKRLKTSEQGQSSFFRVRLTTAPTAPVTCTFSSSDTTEGTLAPTMLVFDSGNFSVFQQVTVSGEDDAIVDGNVLYSVISAPCTSADPIYNGFNPIDIAVTNRDND